MKGNLVSLSYNGVTRTSEVHNGVHVEGKWNAKGPGIPEPQTRGVDARLEGQAIYDLKAERFVSFELLVLSEQSVPPGPLELRGPWSARPPGV